MKSIHTVVVLVLLLVFGLLVACTPTAATPPTSVATEATGEPTSVATEATGEPSTPPTEAPESAAELEEVSVAYVPIIAMAPLYLADELGYFAARGIVNNVQSVANPYDLLGVQSQGELDVNIVGTSAAFFNAVNQGLGVRAVADRMQYLCSSDNLLLARTAAWEEGLKTPADLEGKTIAIIARGSGTEYWLGLILERVGLTLSDVNIVTLSYPDTVNALRTGAIDAGFVVQPLAVTALNEDIARRIVGMHEVLPGQQLGELIFSQDFIERNDGELAKNWLAAWLEGVRFYLDPANKDQVIATISEWTQVEEEVVEQLYGTDQWPWMNPNGDLDVDYIAANDGAWMLEHELIEHLPAPNEYYDDRAIQAAQAEVGRIEFERDCSTVPPLQ